MINEWRAVCLRNCARKLGGVLLGYYLLEDVCVLYACCGALQTYADMRSLHYVLSDHAICCCRE